MIIGERIAALMKEQGVSQGELARRVGVKQPTIFKLIHDNKTGSAHLHKVARELGTTPAFLTGETDDPLSDIPNEPDLTADEREVLNCLRQIAAKDRAALIQLARSLAAVAEEPAGYAPSTPIDQKLGQSPTLHTRRLDYKAKP